MRGVLTAPTGVIYTKNYPDDYPAYTSCTWRISVPWPYTKIRLEFVPKIELEEISILGCFDVVTVRKISSLILKCDLYLRCDRCNPVQIGLHIFYFTPG